MHLTTDEITLTMQIHCKWNAMETLLLLKMRIKNSSGRFNSELMLVHIFVLDQNYIQLQRIEI